MPAFRAAILALISAVRFFNSSVLATAAKYSSDGTKGTLGANGLVKLLSLLMIVLVTPPGPVVPPPPPTTKLALPKPAPVKKS